MTCEGGLGEWKGTDDVPASQNPPCGLKPDQVPQFVAIGFDDNGQVGGMTWAVDMLKNRGKASFFVSSTYMQAAAWKAAYVAGHEIGNHTVTHATDRNVGLPRWLQEMNDSNAYITGQVGVPAEEIFGFRTPYLEYDDDTLTAVKQLGFRYDTSIEEGYEWDARHAPRTARTSSGRTPSTSAAPVTRRRSSGAKGSSRSSRTPACGSCRCTRCRAARREVPKYGVEPGLRTKLKQRQTWFDAAGGHITGFDYNLWASTSVRRLRDDEGRVRRHAQVHVRSAPAGQPRAVPVRRAHRLLRRRVDRNAAGTPPATDRRAAIEEFLDYAKAKQEVEITTYKHVLEYVRNPTVRP